MLGIIQIFIFVGLLRYLQLSENPLSCAIIYGIAHFIFSLILSSNLVESFFSALLVTMLAWVVFWLLHRFNHSFIYWIILAGCIVYFFV